MIVIVGLGNPDKQYSNTYHNVGFITIDHFAEKYGLSFTKKKFKGVVAEGVVCGEKVVLLKPYTYMNLSGQAVAQIKNMLKIDLSELLVVYDDVDIPIGTARFRKNGSAGTHNGMRNIVECLGTTNFARLRVGINSDNKISLIDYVLSQIKGENCEKLDAILPKTDKAIEEFIKSKGKIENIDFNTLWLDFWVKIAFMLHL